MVDKTKVRAELEEQRCLIEQQQVEIQRQRRHIQLQTRLIQSIQAELDALKGTVQRVASIRSPKQGNRGNGLMVATQRVLSGPKPCPQATKRES